MTGKTGPSKQHKRFIRATEQQQKFQLSAIFKRPPPSGSIHTWNIAPASRQLRPVPSDSFPTKSARKHAIYNAQFRSLLHSYKCRVSRRGKTREKTLYNPHYFYVETTYMHTSYMHTIHTYIHTYNAQSRSSLVCIYTHIHQRAKIGTTENATLCAHTSPDL